MNNGGFLQGDALELTWSIIPDGTLMPSQDDGDATCNSNLIATFDGIYGAGEWQAEIQDVWDDWTGLAGNKYTPAVTPDVNGTPIDDGDKCRPVVGPQACEVTFGSAAAPSTAIRTPWRTTSTRVTVT